MFFMRIVFNHFLSFSMSLVLLFHVGSFWHLSGANVHLDISLGVFCPFMPILIEGQISGALSCHSSYVSFVVLWLNDLCSSWLSLYGSLYKSLPELLNCGDCRKNLRKCWYQKNCCNWPKIWTMSFYHRLIHPKDVDGMKNSVDSDQTTPSKCCAPIVHIMSHSMTKWTKWHAPSKDSDQPGHPPSLIIVFTVRLRKNWVLSWPLSAQQRLIGLLGWRGWSKSSLSTRHFVGFVVLGLSYGIIFIGLG